MKNKIPNPKQLVSESYDKIAEKHAEWAGKIRVEERIKYTKILLDRLPERANVLELGCGTGEPTTIQLAERFQITGVDISEYSIELAQKKVPNARFLSADMTLLQFPGSSFDAIVAFYSIIHVPRKEHPKLLEDIASWLRPGGLFVGTMGTYETEIGYDEDWLGVPMYWSFFDSETNRKMVEKAGLKIRTSQDETAIEDGRPITFLWIVAEKPEAE